MFSLLYIYIYKYIYIYSKQKEGGVAEGNSVNRYNEITDNSILDTPDDFRGVIIN